ncbi:MAG: cupin domain-containing protein [Flavobacteriaceae bacterium]
MRGLKIITILLLGIIMNSCNQENKKEESALLFPKGEKIENDHFTGTVYLEMLAFPDSINQNVVGSVTFEPGARTNWHLHLAGQIIIAIDGEGYYQEKGSEKQTIKKGETVKCPPNIPHWHGAAENSKFIQIAIGGVEKGPVEWMETVSDEEYNK